MRGAHEPPSLGLLPDPDFSEIKSVAITLVTTEGQTQTLEMSGEGLQSWLHWSNTVDPPETFGDSLDEPRWPAARGQRFHAVLVLQQARGFTLTTTNATQVAPK